jgi:S1-C subfamily serine protease
MQPAPGEVRFDLKLALDSVVGLRADIPDDAFTAPILGTERTGCGVVIGDDGLVLTIGYLITEAESIWLTANDGTVTPAHPVALDFATGLGLVMPLGPLRLPALARGSASTIAPSDDVFVLGSGGRAHALKATVFAKREFAGYWEYLLEEALFATPAHPEWSGAALVGDDGRLVGVGSLLVQEAAGDDVVKGNMFVPVDLLVPILDDLLRTGRTPGPARPWLGMYTAETPDIASGWTGGQGGGHAGRCGCRGRRPSRDHAGGHVPIHLDQRAGRRRGRADARARWHPASSERALGRSSRIPAQAASAVKSRIVLCGGC